MVVSKIVLSKFLKLASDRILAGLDADRWSGKEREAALTVLKNRGKDISSYLEDEPEFVPANPEVLQTLTDLVMDVLAKDNQDLIDRTITLIGDVENITEFSQEAAEYAVKTISGWIKTRKTDKKIVENQQQRKRDADVRVKDQEISAEKTEIVEGILKDKSLTKKQKVLNMLESGVSRAEILSLKFADATYIYDLHRNWKKNAQN